MRHGVDDVRGGFEATADAIVVGTGAGGGVAAANLARAGMRVVVLEAGAEMRAPDMTRNAPLVLARHYWDGGMRTVGGTGDFPCMQGRCLGGSTVVNSAIMLSMPQWVREEWRQESGLDLFTDPALDAAYERVYERLRVAPTPLTVLGRRNLIVRDALEAVGLHGKPLPRAVVDCEGCADCMTGCTSGAKQSTDRTYLVDAERDGAEVFTCSVVDRVLMEGTRAVGVSGNVVDPVTWRRLGRFTVRAPRVVLAAGAVNTPALLLNSGIKGGGQVGATLYAHLSGAVVGRMEEVVDPWIGATQGWGAIVDDIPGLKLECLWAPISALMVRWGDVGLPFLEMLQDVRHTTVIAAVYKGKMRGSVKVGWGGAPRPRLYIPDAETHTLNRGLKLAADALLKVGARHVYAGMPGTKPQMRTTADTEAILSPSIRARHMNMTANHIFCSVRMGARAADSAVDETGQVRGVTGVYVNDASLFPLPTAVNPQATIMAVVDILSRRMGDLPI